MSPAVPPHTPRGATGRGARRARRAVAAVLAVGALALGACTAPGAAPAPSAAPGSSTPVQSDGTGAGGQTAPAAEVPKGLESYYGQRPAWETCHDEFECATISAPLDYSQPEGEKIQLALIKTPATRQDSRIGSLVTNPGGPGGSGISYLTGGGLGLFSSELRASYDLVSFDPRGVGASTAVRCLDGEQNDQRRASAEVPDTEAKAERSIEQAKAYADACAANSPTGLLAHVDTDSSARDLDLIRAVLGDTQLHYMGFSYGTKLGATYAGLFPRNVGRLVLDGAMDPSLDVEAVSDGQAKAFERALDLFLESCLAGDGCPLGGDVKQARADLTAWLGGLEEEPLELDDGRVLTSFDAIQALLIGMYEPLIAPQLVQGLQLAMEHGDGSILMGYADQSYERGEDGTYANTNDAFNAINCADYTHGAGTASALLAKGERLTREAPFFGRFMGYDDACSQWSVKNASTPAPIKAPADLPAILIVGTTGDPATPYAWSQSLQKQLPNSALLTYQGEGHTAYGRSNDCTASAVDAYLLRGDVPSGGAARC